MNKYQKFLINQLQVNNCNITSAPIGFILSGQTMDAAQVRRKMLKPLSRNFYREHKDVSPIKNNTLSFSNTINIMLNHDKHYQSASSGLMSGNGLIDIMDLGGNGFGGRRPDESRRNMGSKGFEQDFKYQYYEGDYMAMVDEFQNILKRLNPSSINSTSLRLALQQVLGRYQSQTVSKTLTSLLNHETLKNEAKVALSSDLMIACLALIKSFIRNNLTKILDNPFTTVNQINKSLLEYLKSKYPKKKGLAVPIDLDNEFESVNYLDMFQNDMLVNSGFTFTAAQDSRADIFDKAKKFINCTLNQVDAYYGQFGLLLNKIFKSKEEQRPKTLTDGKQNTTQIAHLSSSKFKISRKLPQSTQKYFEFGTESMDIGSPQLFRVLIKWIQGMEQLLNNPSDIITNMLGIKYIKQKNKHLSLADDNQRKQKGYGNAQFEEIQSRRFESLKIDIIEKISEIKDKSYKKQMNALIDKLNHFNNNLLKILTIRSPKSKFIEEEQAQSLKFAKFNAQFLQWLIMEKFLIIVKNLSLVTAHFQNKVYKKLDLINFHVFDLMRASFSGKKQEVIEAFKNLRNQQEKGEIEIIRIKNRLHTPLNDVLINFKMCKSFIICQLQLILIDLHQEGEEKLKYVQDINHILYELERSPYGSLTQMALIVDHFDPTIFYERKINFGNDHFDNQLCIQNNGQKKHDFIEIKEQQTPFICAWCVKFYPRLQNYFEYHQCIKCGLEKCKACAFQQNMTEEKRVYFRNFAYCILGIKQPIEESQQLKDDDFIDNFFMRQDHNFILEHYVRIREHINVESGAKIDKLQKLLLQYQKQYGLKATQPFYCFLLKFENGNPLLKLIKYENYKVNILIQHEREDLSAKQLSLLIQKQKKTRLHKHDVLFLLKKRFYLNQKQSDGTYINRCRLSQIKTIYYMTNISKKVCIAGKKQYRAVSIHHRKKKFLLQLIKMSKNTQDDDSGNEATEQVLFNKEELRRVIDKTINKCVSYKLQRHTFQLQNLGLNQNILVYQLMKEKGGEDRVRGLKWAKDVQILNLSQNSFKNIKPITQIFTNIKQLYISKNTISSLAFLQALQNMKILDISQNNIKQVNGDTFKNCCKCLILLKLSFNSIQKIPILQLPELEELYLNKNKITSFNNLFQSKIPYLEILDISYNSLAGRTVFSWDSLKGFSKLRKLEAKKINLAVADSASQSIPQNQQNPFLNITHLPKLQYLQLSQNKLYLLNKIQQRKLREIHLSYCEIKQIHNVFTNKLQNLQYLQLRNNDIRQFPAKLELPQLLHLKLNSNKIKLLTNIKDCYLPKLQILELQSNGMRDIGEIGAVVFDALRELSLQHNSIEQLPVLKLPCLQSLNLNNNKLQNISNLSCSQLPTLKQLHLKNNSLKSLPYLNFPELQQLNPIHNDITELKQFSKSYLPKMTRFSFYRNHLLKMDFQFNFPNLHYLFLFDNQLSHIGGLAISDLGALKTLSVSVNKLVGLPVLKLASLEVFNATKNLLQDIEVLNSWETPKLRILDIRFNRIRKLKAVKDLPLQVIDISNNQLQDISEFCANSKLPMLRKFTASNNKKLTKFGGNFSGCQRIQQLTLNNCSLDSFDELGIIEQNNLNQHSSRLKYLRVINLQYNLITHLPASQSLNYLQSLQKLLLRHNKITKINYKFGHFKSLKVLYLSTNFISSLDSQDFQENKTLVQFSVTKNPLKSIKLPQSLRLRSLTINGCALNDDIFKNIQLPFLRQLFLIRNQMTTLNVFSVQGAFTALKKLMVQENNISRVAPLYLPQLTDLSLLQNPFVDISGILQSFIPAIKTIYFGHKFKKFKNKKKNVSKQKEEKTLKVEKVEQKQEKKQKQQKQEKQQQQGEIEGKEEGKEGDGDRQEISEEGSLNSDNEQIEKKKNNEQINQARIIQQMKAVLEELKKIYPNLRVRL